MEPKTYRKKPVDIRAMTFEGGAESASRIIDWILANGGTARYHEYQPAWESEDGGQGRGEQPEHIAIDTLEGTMSVLACDKVIQGVAGEFYPCKPDIFAATYEAV